MPGPLGSLRRFTCICQARGEGLRGLVRGYRRLVATSMVRNGATFVNGKLVERPAEDAQPEAA